MRSSQLCSMKYKVELLFG
uniref:Uncharacterized protein n=1 Tax=Rhizophora mucronata TaxID=61149 RepID=A0A2P2QFG1_RHIMU